MRKTPSVVLWLILLLLSGCLLAGCPSDTSGAPVERCEKIGQKCKLGGGQLGICTMDTSGQLQCQPQH